MNAIVLRRNEIDESEVSGIADQEIKSDKNLRFNNFEVDELTDAKQRRLGRWPQNLPILE